MKIVSLPYLLFITLFLTCSCHLESEYYVHYEAEPVAEGYVFSDSLFCKLVEVNEDGLATFHLGIDDNDKSVRYYHKDDDLFHQLSVKHKDSFTGDLGKYTFSKFGICFAKDFASIDITCGKDYDTQHPAGTSLADIVDYKVISIYPWIRGGYDASSEKVFWITKPLNTITQDDMTMIFILIFIKLSLKSAPNEKGDYPFCITLITDDGLTYEVNQSAAL